LKKAAHCKFRRTRSLNPKKATFLIRRCRGIYQDALNLKYEACLQRLKRNGTSSVRNVWCHAQLLAATNCVTNC
jgi:hypothetical protein